MFLKIPLKYFFSVRPCQAEFKVLNLGCFFFFFYFFRVQLLPPSSNINTCRQRWRHCRVKMGGKQPKRRRHLCSSSMSREISTSGFSSYATPTVISWSIYIPPKCPHRPAWLFVPPVTPPVPAVAPLQTSQPVPQTSEFQKTDKVYPQVFATFVFSLFSANDFSLCQGPSV